MLALAFAWRNVWRHKWRSGLTVAAIAFSCLLLVFSTSFQIGTYAQSIENSVRLQTGHVQVQAAGWHDKPDMRRVIEDPAAVAAVLARIDGVTAWAPRAEAFALASSARRSQGTLIIGIDPAREAALTTVDDAMREGEWLAPGDGAAAVVGQLLANNLKLALGDELVVLGQGRDGATAATIYLVKGIFETGADEIDRGLIQVPLADFDATFYMRGAVHRIAVLVDGLEAVPQAAAAIADALPQTDTRYPPVVLDWEEMLPGLRQGIALDFYSALIFYAFLVVVVTFSILNTFLMAILERMREFGVMTALGMTRWRLLRLVMLESALMTGVGIAIGTAAGAAVTLWVQDVGIVFSGGDELMAQYGLPERLFPKLTAATLLTGPGVVLAVTLLAALYPALRLLGLKPVPAMRTAAP